MHQLVAAQPSDRGGNALPDALDQRRKLPARHVVEVVRDHAIVFAQCEIVGSDVQHVIEPRIDSVVQPARFLSSLM